MTVAIAVVVNVAVGDCRDNEKLAGWWWHTITVAATVAVAVSGCREDEKLAG